MTAVHLSLPEEAIVRGALYAENDPAYLVQDLLEVELPRGIFIDVGWYPDHDPNGHYRIVVFERSWDNQLADYVTTDVTDVKFQVESLAERFLAPIQPL